MSRRLVRLAIVPTTLLVVGLLVPTLASAQGETVEYYGVDAIGSVRIVFNASGAVVGRKDYAPFGEELGAAAGIPSERFAGLSRDGEAGLDYAQARMYQFRTGRFNAPDPVYAGLFAPQAWNRYSYALNNPLTFIDPSGLMADDCKWTEKWVAGEKDGEGYLSSELQCPTGQGGSGGGGWADFLAWMNSTWTDSFSPHSSGNGDNGESGGGVTTIRLKLDMDSAEVQMAASPQAAAAAAIISAIIAVGKAAPALGQRAAVAGTRAHTAVKNAIDALNLPGVHTEVSYLLGNIEKWGKPGSIRLDVVQYGSNGQILRIFDLKTGDPWMSLQRMERIYRQLPDAQRPPIVIIKP